MLAREGLVVFIEPFSFLGINSWDTDSGRYCRTGKPGILQSLGS